MIFKLQACWIQKKIYKSKENIKENDKLNPLSNYSKNKLITENLLKRRLGSNLLILRISNIIGFKLKFRKNLHQTFVDLFYEKAKKGLIYDNANRFKDFLSVIGNNDQKRSKRYLQCINR